MAALSPADESFLDSAPQRYTHTWQISEPADVVWAQLTGDQPLHWIRGMSIEWTSATPHGVDSTRTAHVFGPLISVQERYFLWEDDPSQPRRKAFAGTAMNLPLFARLAEDYRVESTGPGSCAYTWTIAIEPAPLARPGAKLNDLVFALAFRDTSRHFHAA